MNQLAFQQDRSIRVFISSTFRDMHEEREVLIKHIFPRVRKLCEERRVAFSEVDLRWGITQERAERGEVLPICLAEIDRCRPFFIGLLGERYGWVPDSYPPEVVHQQPWLKEHRDKSVTELEILHGILANPTMARRANFYFRDPAYVEKLPVERRADFAEQDASAREKLTQLKNRIRSSGLGVRENYSDPQQLGQWVLEDLTAALNELYPAEETPPPLDIEAALHDAFALHRTEVYLGRREYVDRLNEHVAGVTAPVVVLGESGAGKSALLANWVAQYRESHPGDFVFVHFIGATLGSAHWATILRRVMGELKRKCGIQQDVPTTPEELPKAFADWLQIVASQRRVVLVLDALDQLDDRDGAPNLVWLPNTLPNNVRLIASTLPGASLDEWITRGWPTLTVAPLTPDERKRLIRDFLGQYSKQLNDDQAARVADSPQAANPLYLVALLNDLRVFGSYDRLDERIGYYLAAATIGDLYQRILERYEQDYDGGRSGLVRDAMALLWASRHGLLESELLNLLGSDGNPLPQARWSPLSLAAEHSLTMGNGLLNFFHAYLRQAVEKRYLATDEVRAEHHLRLADYFQCLEPSARRTAELPWQLAEARSWDRLYALLADLTFLKTVDDEVDVLDYWTRLERHTTFRRGVAYRPVIDDPAGVNDPLLVVSVANLLRPEPHVSLVVGSQPTTQSEGDIGRAEFTRLYEYLMGHYHAAGENMKALLAATNLTTAMLGCRSFEVLERCQIIENWCDALSKGGYQGHPAINTALTAISGHRAIILAHSGERAASLDMLRQQEQIARDGGDTIQLASALNNQAIELIERGEFPVAEPPLREAEQLCRARNDMAMLAGVLQTHAVLLFRQGDERLEEALLLGDEAESIARRIGVTSVLMRSLPCSARILESLGRLDEASERLVEHESLSRQLGELQALQDCLAHHSRVRKSLGQIERALELLWERVEIQRQRGDKKGLSDALRDLVTLSLEQERTQGCFALLREREKVCRELSDVKSLQHVMAQQADLRQRLGDYEGAYALLQKQETLCRESDNRHALGNCLCNQALALTCFLNRHGEGLKYISDAHTIANENNLGNLGAYVMQTFATAELQVRKDAAALRKLGYTDAALKLLVQLEQVSRSLNAPQHALTSLGDQLSLQLFDRGDFQACLRIAYEQAQISREIPNRPALARALLVQASLLAENLNRPWEGLPLAEEALSIAQEEQLHDLLPTIEAVLVNCRP